MNSEMIKVFIKDIQGTSLEYEVNINDPVSSLINKYKTSISLSDECSIKLNNQGRSVNSNKTFKEENIQDEVTLSAITKIESEIRVYIKDSQGNSREFKVNIKDQVSSLIQKYKNSIYLQNGSSLKFFNRGILINNMYNTLKEEGIKNDDNLYVEITIPVTEVRNEYRPPPQYKQETKKEKSGFFSFCEII